MSGGVDNHTSDVDCFQTLAEAGAMQEVLRNSSVEVSDAAVAIARPPSTPETAGSQEKTANVPARGGKGLDRRKSTLSNRAERGALPLANEQSFQLPSDLESRFVDAYRSKMGPKLKERGFKIGVAAALGAMGIGLVVKAAVTGATIGSVIPGVGTIVGACVGAAIAVVSAGCLGLVYGNKKGEIKGREEFLKARQTAGDLETELRKLAAGNVDDSLGDCLERLDKIGMPRSITRDMTKHVFRDCTLDQLARIETYLNDWSSQYRNDALERVKEKCPKRRWTIRDFKLRKIAPSFRTVLVEIGNLNLLKQQRQQVANGGPDLCEKNIRHSTVQEFTLGKTNRPFSAEYNGSDEKWVVKRHLEDTRTIWPAGDSSCSAETKNILFTSEVADRWLTPVLGYNPCGKAVLAKTGKGKDERLAVAVRRFSGVEADDIYRGSSKTEREISDVAERREALSWNHPFDYVMFHFDRHADNMLLKKEDPTKTYYIDNGTCMGEGPVPPKGIQKLAPLDTMILTESQCKYILENWRAKDLDECAAGRGMSGYAVKAAKQRLEALKEGIRKGTVKQIPDRKFISRRYGEHWLNTIDRWRDALAEIPRKKLTRDEKQLLDKYDKERQHVVPEMFSGRRLARKGYLGNIHNFAWAAHRLIDYSRRLHEAEANHPLVHSKVPLVLPRTIWWELKYILPKPKIEKQK